MRTPLDDVGSNAHGWCGWVDVRVAHHKFLENIILDSATELMRLDSRLFRRMGSGSLWAGAVANRWRGMGGGWLRRM